MLHLAIDPCSSAFRRKKVVPLAQRWHRPSGSLIRVRGYHRRGGRSELQPQWRDGGADVLGAALNASVSDPEGDRSEAVRARLDQLVDDASRQSFPASDAPALQFDDGALVGPEVAEPSWERGETSAGEDARQLAGDRAGERRASEDRS
jgi:hypothetical protein